MSNLFSASSRSTSGPTPVPALRRESHPAAERRLRDALMPWLAGIFTVALLSIVTIAWQHREERALRTMPAAERRALYERTMQTLRGPCSPPDPIASPSASDAAHDALDGALLDHCRHEAELLRRFPECDGACVKLATRFLAQPSR